jgi:hypothetical protein
MNSSANSTTNPSIDYIAKHKQLIKTHGVCLSSAREYLHQNNLNKLRASNPSVLINYFLLRYFGTQLLTRITGNCIIIDGIPYQVVFDRCTPSSFKQSNKNGSSKQFWASFRRFHSDYNLPATVVISPASPASNTAIFPALTELESKYYD